MFKLSHDCFESFMKQCKLLKNVVYPRAKHYCMLGRVPQKCEILRISADNTIP